MSKQLHLAVAALAAAASALAAAIPGGEGAAAETNTGTTGTAGGKTGKTGKGGKTEPAKPTHSRAELTAVLNEVKESKGASVAKALIKDVGKSDKLVEVKDENVDALYDAAKAALDEGDDGDEGEDDGL